MENLFDLSGKVAVVTGSSKGIGRAIAEQMAFHGADVVISSRREDACQEVAEAINGESGDRGGSGDSYRLSHRLQGTDGKSGE